MSQELIHVLKCLLRNNNSSRNNMRTRLGFEPGPSNQVLVTNALPPCGTIWNLPHTKQLLCTACCNKVVKSVFYTLSLSTKYERAQKNTYFLFPLLYFTFVFAPLFLKIIIFCFYNSCNKSATQYFCPKPNQIYCKIQISAYK